MNSPTRHIALARAGYRCAFPGCTTPVKTDEGATVLEIAHIVPQSLGGTDDLDNLIVLCPTHHRFVDMSAGGYGPERLLEMRRQLEMAVAREPKSNSTKAPAIGLPDQSRVRFESTLSVWRKHRANSDEGFWHAFFANNAHVLALTMPGDALLLGDKCYLGGKTIRNQNSKIVDFVYMPRSYQGITLFEIKVPTTPLVGSEYRNQCFAPAPDLAGAVVQAMDYRRLASIHLHDLVRELDRQPTSVAIRCAVIVGDRRALQGDGNRLHCFELFRAGLRDVQVITYDELFEKVHSVLQL